MNKLDVKNWNVLPKKLFIFFVICMCTITVFAQEGISIAGTISGNNEPIPGVNVVVKGTTTGTIADIDGKYSVNVPNTDATLVFSFVGYITQEILVGNQRNINVNLIQESQEIEETVGVGYGTQRARDITSSVANVQMGNLANMSVTGIDQALTGQVAGVNINRSNSVSGGGTDIRIRGTGAVGAASQPLYVVDGFPLTMQQGSSTGEISSPINDIPPQDIASITILKDAAATAIYGSRGANGVVLVTTHSGQRGKAKVQLNAYTGLQQIIKEVKPDMMNATEYATFQKERYEDFGATVPAIYQHPERYGKGTNWFEEITQIAPINEITLSVSGGTDNITSYVSLGYLNQEGVVMVNKFERYSIRANIDAKVSNKINVGVSISTTYTQRARSTGRSTNEVSTSFSMSPIHPLKNPDGSYNLFIWDGPETVATGYANPVYNLKATDQYTHGQRFTGTIFGEYEIIPRLKFKTAFNADWSGNNASVYIPSTILGQSGGQIVPTIPTNTYTQSGYLNWQSENTLNYQKNFGNHALSILLGHSYQQERSNSASFTGTDYTSDDVQAMGAAPRISAWSTSLSDWCLISQYFRVTYDYKQKYLFTGTIRRDASSRFGRDNRWGIFPSASIGWRIKDERFMQQINWISELKLRASYGVSGNFNIGNYTYMSEITANNYSFNGVLEGGRRMNTLGNPKLGWERMHELNVGFDFGILSNRITLQADFYKRNTLDLLLDVSVPQSSGYETAKENNGDLQNTGIEISLVTRNITGSDFTWSTNFNIAFNRNKVIRLGRANAPIYAGRTGEQSPTHISIVGKPVSQFFGYQVEGILRASDFDSDGNCLVPAFPGAVPGNLKVKDVDGNGVIKAVNDFEIIGNPFPDYTWGMTNVFRYKQFDLRIQMTGSMGGQLLKTEYETTHHLDGNYNVRRDVMNRYRSEEQPGNGRIPTTAGIVQGRALFRDVNSDWVKNNDYLWVKNISLGYAFQTRPGSVISNARVYVSIQNALLFTGYDGNPEVVNYGDPTRPERSGPLVIATDNSANPVPRTYSLGINLSF